MSTGLRHRFAGILVRGIVLLCLGGLCAADSAHAQRKTKKPQLPPLPSGPTGPVPQIPLDSIAPVAPQVTYQAGQLTIVAPNSTLGDILRAVHKQTGAEIEVPAANDRVVTHLGPGSAREVIAELLNGSRFNYVLMGSPDDSSVLTRVVLVAKSGAEANPPGQMAQQIPQPQAVPGGAMVAQQPADEAPPDAADADAPEENTVDDAAADQAAEDQAGPPPEQQQGVKTPQQMLQEMQQRQLQIQQQQQQGQPGQLPPPGLRPPERNDPPQQQ